jgi:hypothetical protein
MVCEVFCVGQHCAWSRLRFVSRPTQQTGLSASSCSGVKPANRLSPHKTWIAYGEGACDGPGNTTQKTVCMQHCAALYCLSLHARTNPPLRCTTGPHRASRGAAQTAQTAPFLTCSSLPAALIRCRPLLFLWSAFSSLFAIAATAYSQISQLLYSAIVHGPNKHTNPYRPPQNDRRCTGTHI